MKKVFLSILIVFILVGTWFLARDLFFLDPLKTEKRVNELLEEINGKVLLPSPLRSSSGQEIGAPLNKDEIIKHTNIQREKYGLGSLKESSQLYLSAQSKTEDIFLRQYFEHESPTGLNVSDLVKKAGYEFIVLGENLAMGNFDSNEDLVQAWMDSPGHRENILNSSFSEIGVAVLKGYFEGEEVWVAVQHFALPLSACSAANEAIKETIAANEKKIVSIEEVLNSMKGDLKTRKNLKEYNDLVELHNSLVAKNKALIKEYNKQIRSYNQCLMRSL